MLLNILLIIHILHLISRIKNNEWGLSVTDQGRGIEDAHIARLTERFYRVDDARNRKEGGAGLGLSIVSSILSRHKARLDIQSEVNKGSTFTALFPKFTDNP